MYLLHLALKTSYALYPCKTSSFSYHILVMVLPCFSYKSCTQARLVALRRGAVVGRRRIKLQFHDADTDIDTDILARIVADTSNTRDFLKLFLWQAERHTDILATILATMSARMSVSAPWNASLK